MSLILLSNDDGVYAPGLIALDEALSEGAEVRVIAPSRDRSGVSNSLTLDRPLHAQTLPNQYIAVDGTPTDCVHLGTANIFMPVPGRVVSGINLGANMGDDVLYSGTVAAAMEGRFLDKPAVAISLDTHKAEVEVEDFRDAARLACRLVELLDGFESPPRTVYNINLPDLPPERIKGVRLTVLGERLRGENPISVQNPRGKTLYWIGRSGGPVDAREGTDFHAVANGYISITPIHADMTRHGHLPDMEGIVSSASQALVAELGGRAPEQQRKPE